MTVGTIFAAVVVGLIVVTLIVALVDGHDTEDDGGFWG